MALQVPDRALLRSIKGKYSGLAAEALKHNTFEDFKKAYTTDIRHGRYYHLTDNPNFSIDPQRGPRDLSSMASGQESPGQLMVTSHLEHWDEHYNRDPQTGRRKVTRPYVAEIDLSEAPKNTYHQVNRGFGNEFFVNPEGTARARVTRVMTVDQAKRRERAYHAGLPSSEARLEAFYNAAHAVKQ